MSLKRINDLRNSLLFRLAVLYAATFAVLALIGFTIFYYRIYSVTIERIDEELYEDTQIYAEMVAGHGFSAVRRKILSDAKTEDPVKEFSRVLNARAEVLTATDMTTWDPVERHGPIDELSRHEADYVTQTIGIKDGERARIITARIGPSMFLQIGETMEDTDEYLDIFRELLMILIVAFILIASVFGWYLARRSLAGMGEVTKAAEDIIKGNYNRRVEVAGQFRELKRLSATFNTMLDRIQNLLQSMQQINDNIAHDLRSPLARIRGIAEMTIVKKNQIEAYKEMAVSTIEECDTLIDMINTMLDITEIEAGVNEAQVEQFDLNLLIAEACELFHPLAIGKEINLKSELPDTLYFKGDRKRMQRIVTNLLENAIKYTPQYGDVSIHAQRESKRTRIDVRDTGSGIAESDLTLIFQRFYRCDQSRSQPGVGLGLSLVKAYTESMNGTIAVRSVLNHGTMFSLRFGA